MGTTPPLLEEWERVVVDVESRRHLTLTRQDGRVVQVSVADRVTIDTERSRVRVTATVTAQEGLNLTNRIARERCASRHVLAVDVDFHGIAVRVRHRVAVTLNDKLLSNIESCIQVPVQYVRIRCRRSDWESDATVLGLSYAIATRVRQERRLACAGHNLEVVRAEASNRNAIHFVIRFFAATRS